MFADTMNTWELGLAPTPLSYAKDNLGQEEDAFYAIEGSQGNDNDLLIDTFETFDAPLDLDIFEQELKKHETGTEDIKPLVANSTFIDDAFDNNLAVIADPKMLTAAAATTEDDSGLGSMMLVDESTGMDVEDTQNLIEEMESFLKQHENIADDAPALEAKPAFAEVVPSQGLDLLEQVMEEVDRMPLKEEMSASQPAALSAEDSEQAEAILDALIKGDLTTDFESSINNATVEIVEETPTTITQRQVIVPQSKPKKPVFSGINNISEVVTADGQKIVIVIANDVPEAAQNIKAQVAATLPNPAKAYQQPQETITTIVSEAEEYSSDSDWSPYSPAATRKKTTSVGRPSVTKGVSVGRVAKQRGPYSKRAHASIKDKKERKKLQNVEAARRYRDKKKAEQTVIESEEDILERKNKNLKGKLSEMENELKTLKKLMTELGLVK